MITANVLSNHVFPGPDLILAPVSFHQHSSEYWCRKDNFSYQIRRRNCKYVYLLTSELVSYLCISFIPKM